MSELRAPDPTLAVAGGNVVVSWGDHGGVAHLYPARRRPDDHRDVPDSWYSIAVMPAEVAAYVAVPCRECFPDAPPPGRLPCPCLDDHPGCAGMHDDRLAWQVTA